MTRDQLIQFATIQYFGNVDRKALQATLDCFHETAHFTIQTAQTRHDGKAEIRRMFEDFFKNFETIIHRDFVCSADPKENRIAASFVAELHAHDGSVTLLNNTNFWRLRDGRFQEVFVYMSGANPLV